MNDELIKWLGSWGTLISLIMGIIGIWGVFITWKAWNKTKRIEKFLENEKSRLNEKIKMTLKNGENEYNLPALRRQDITRSEIQGRLGAIPMKTKGKRYSIEFTNDFYSQIDIISEGSNESGHSSLTINCTKDEFDQFNFELPKTKINKKVSEDNGK